jgi:polyhydroxybutyrate depolymerase
MESTPMTGLTTIPPKNRTAVLTMVFLLLALPALGSLYAAASFHFRNRNTGSIVSSGDLREYVLHVPPSYDRSRPAPLVISMHGAGAWPVQQMEMSRWNRLADRDGFLVVYPAGRGRLRIWRVDSKGGLERDVRFISDLIDEIGSRYEIDRDRIYANGFSNGGAMTFVLTCTLSDRIAAVGMVGAAQTVPSSWCDGKRPMPMINFHGTDDTAAPYEGGSSWVLPRGAPPFPSVRKWTANWAERNGCDDEPAGVAVAPDVTRTAWSGCEADVVLYTIHGGGHTWPGGEPLPDWFVGRTTDNLDASAEMWQFFRERPLSTRNQESAR